MMARLAALFLGTMVLNGCTLMTLETAQDADPPVLLRMSARDAAAVPEGARVEIVRCFPNSDPKATTTGVVLKASPEGLALANCVVEGGSTDGAAIVNKIPYFSRLYKNTGVGRTAYPVLWVPLYELSTVRVLEPAPAGYVAPMVEIETANTAPRGVDIDWAETNEDSRS